MQKKIKNLKHIGQEWRISKNNKCVDLKIQNFVNKYRKETLKFAKLGKKCKICNNRSLSNNRSFWNNIFKYSLYMKCNCNFN